MAVHRKRKPWGKKLPSVGQVGHGKPNPKKLTASQLKRINNGEAIYVTIHGWRKRVTSANVRKGYIYWYRRSDGGPRGKICLRNFQRDRNYPARRKAVKGKPFTGD